jgi:hypothetical protein
MASFCEIFPSILTRGVRNRFFNFGSVQFGFLQNRMVSIQSTGRFGIVKFLVRFGFLCV